MSKIINNQFKLKIVEDFSKGLSAKECCLKYKIHNTTLYRYLKQNNITVKSRFTPKNIELIIIKDYLNNISQCKIQEKYGLQRSTIKKILIRNNIKLRNSSETTKRYTYDNDYFKTINTPEKAYFLGLLISDGTNIRNGFRIMLQEEDLHILEDFKKDLKYTGNIYIRKKKNENCKKLCDLIIYDQNMSDDLSKLGCIPAKSHHTYFPNIPEEFHSHFIRGVFDGDGCIHISGGQKCFTIMGNILLVEKIQKILIKECNLKKNSIRVSHRCKNNIVEFRYGGNKNCKKLFNYLYKDATVFLKRKFEKFKYD